MLRPVAIGLFCLLASARAVAMQGMDHSMHGAIHNMKVTDTGVVMNENRDILPRGCDAISAEHEITVYAGREYASVAPGTMFGMDKNEWRVEPCSMITVTFVNKDATRHQWMVHGLPKYLYSTGMFHIEAMGGQTQTGTFIVPGEDRNYLVHCDMAQHMEKGMRAQLVVGSGGGDLWGVPGISDAFYRFSYLPPRSVQLAIGTLLAAFIATMLWLRSRARSQASSEPS